MNVIEDLQWRGLLKQHTDLDELLAALSEGLSFYCGFDPTAESLHVGSLLQLITARRLQRAGHRPVLLVGGGTGLIGDPKPNAERKLADEAQVQSWADAITDQVRPFLDLDGDNAALVVNNAEWIKPMTVLDFLRDVGKHFPVNRMLARSVVASRLNPDDADDNTDEDTGEAPRSDRVEDGISFTEFSYILLQSLDFCELFQRHNVTLQFGGSDQWGNIASGVELTRRRADGQVHGFTTPLLTKPDGAKFGKTEDGTVWLDPTLTTPFQFHQFWLNTPDSMCSQLLRFLSMLDHAGIEALETSLAEEPHRKLAQHHLADEMTALVHGPHVVANVKALGEALFHRGTFTPAVLELASGELGVADVTRSDLASMMVQAGFFNSKGEARRAVKEGSLRVNGVRVEADFTFPHGVTVVQRGKRSMAVRAS